MGKPVSTCSDALVHRRIILLLLAGAALASPAWAQPAAYRVDLQNSPTRPKVGVLIRFTIADPNGAPVTSAAILAARLDRTDIAGPNVAPVTITPLGDYGVYALRTDFNAWGAYALTVLFRPRSGADPVSATATLTVERPRPANPASGG